jgi:hypothetical protein
MNKQVQDKGDKLKLNKIINVFSVHFSQDLLHKRHKDSLV